MGEYRWPTRSSETLTPGAEGVKQAGAYKKTPAINVIEVSRGDGNAEEDGFCEALYMPS
jgi:hypothetical protein